MDKADAEFLISYILSAFADSAGVEIQDIKIKEERSDTVFISGPTYMVEITYK